MYVSLFFVNLLLKNVNLCLFFELFWFIDGAYRHKWPLEEVKTKKSSPCWMKKWGKTMCHLQFMQTYAQTYAWDILAGSQIKINIWNIRNFRCSWLSRYLAISSEEDCWSASLAHIATICWHCFSIAIRKLTFLLHPVQIHKILKLAFFRFELKCAPIPWLLQNYLLSGLTCPLVGNSSFKSSVFSSLCHSLEPHR